MNLKVSDKWPNLSLQAVWGLILCWLLSIDLATALNVLSCEISHDGFVGKPDPAEERWGCHPVAAGYDSQYQLYAFFMLMAAFLFFLGFVNVTSRLKRKSLFVFLYGLTFMMPFLLLGIWNGRDHYPMSGYIVWSSLLFPFLTLPWKRD